MLPRQSNHYVGVLLDYMCRLAQLFQLRCWRGFVPLGWVGGWVGVGHFTAMADGEAASAGPTNPLTADVIIRWEELSSETDLAVLRAFAVVNGFTAKGLTSDVLYAAMRDEVNDIEDGDDEERQLLILIADSKRKLEAKRKASGDAPKKTPSKKPRSKKSKSKGKQKDDGEDAEEVVESDEE